MGIAATAGRQGAVPIGIGGKTICLSGKPIARGNRIPYLIPIRVTHLHVLEHIAILVLISIWSIQSENPKLCQFGGTIRPTGSKLTRHLRSRLYLLTETDGNRRLVCTGFVGRFVSFRFLCFRPGRKGQPAWLRCARVGGQARPGYKRGLKSVLIDSQNVIIISVTPIEIANSKLNRIYTNFAIF